MNGRSGMPVAMPKPKRLPWYWSGTAANVYWFRLAGVGEHGAYFSKGLLD